MVKNFYDVINQFMAFAESMRPDLSEDQIQSAFLCASACYAARYICSDGSSAHGSQNEQIVSTTEAFCNMLQDAVRFHNNDAQT